MIVLWHALATEVTEQKFVALELRVKRSQLSEFACKERYRRNLFLHRYGTLI